MLSISYPKNQLVLRQEYLSLFDEDAINTSIAWALPTRSDYDLDRLALDKLLFYTLEELVDVSSDLNLKKAEAEAIACVLNYDNPLKGRPKFQDRISNFFMENAAELNLSCCYYCNIDYINTFSDIGDYRDGLDFVNNASQKELRTIEGIEKATANKIVNSRKKKKIADLSELGLSRDLTFNLNNLLVKELHNHFTLDHVICKSKYPLAALSLYNLVPSCYSCNSKFKGSKPLIQLASESYLSPTSSFYSFAKDVEFKMYFKVPVVSKWKDITQVSDFTLDFEFSKNADEYARYISIFKLRSRYKFHKRSALILVEKAKRYHEANIKSIEKLTTIDASQLRNDIFGEELFSGDLESKPLTKFHRDIAKQIGIMVKI